MELNKYAAILHRWIWMIVLVTTISAISAALYSWFVATPKYESSTTILVNQKRGGAFPATSMYENVMANQALVKTYSDIMESNSILLQVIQQLKLEYTVNQLQKMISVTSTEQSAVITVSVTNPDVHRAVDIANALVQAFRSRIVSLMDVQNVQIVDPAVVPNHPMPVSPNKVKNIVIASFLGLLISIGLALLIEYLDDTVKSEEDVLEYLDLPILGTITKIPVRKLSGSAAVTLAAQLLGE